MILPIMRRRQRNRREQGESRYECDRMGETFARHTARDDIARVTEPHRAAPIPAAGDRPRIARALLLAGASLTLVFTAQDAVRRAVAGQRFDAGRSLAINGIDWGVWAVLAAVMIANGAPHRLDDPRRRALRVAVWLATAIVACIVHAATTGALMYHLHLVAFAPQPGGGAPPLSTYLRNWITSSLGFNFIIFLMIAGVIHAVLYYRDMRARAVREAELAARLANAELSALRTQLQPHFLFNALHTVSSLMIADVPAAHRVVTSLGDLLRASLDHTARQEITLREELAFVSAYLDIQKARFRSRLAVEIDVPDSLGNALVPALVLQPLVENAIRHGIEPDPDGGTVRIAATAAGSVLTLSVRNDGTSGASAAASPGGIGLTNIERRLAQLYGASQSFAAGPSAIGEFVVTMTLPLHTTARSPARDVVA
jgi:hypothetical protein